MSVYSIEVPDCVWSVVCQSLNSLFDRCDFKSGFGENTWSQLLRDLILTNWFMTCFFGKRCKSADMRVTLLSYFSLSWWVSAGGGVLLYLSGLAAAHTGIFFHCVVQSLTWLWCDMFLPQSCAGWLFIANWSKRKQENWLDIRALSCVRKFAEAIVFVSSPVFHSLDRRSLIWPSMMSLWCQSDVLCHIS